MIRPLIDELIAAADDVGPGWRARQKKALTELGVYGAELFERGVVALERIAAAQERANPAPQSQMNQPQQR